MRSVLESVSVALLSGLPVRFLLRTWLPRESLRELRSMVESWLTWVLTPAQSMVGQMDRESIVSKWISTPVRLRGEN
jgi:hypothetical protein